MTKLIAILILVGCLFVGWRLFIYWDQVSHEEEVSKKKQQASEIVSGEQLGGLSPQLESTLQAAQKQGAAGLRQWLKTYGSVVQDPRKAWIQLDYCIAEARENPAEARRVFNEVKARVPPTSPVYPRIKRLESTYQ
ncbi:MAG TPA: hypothetical protein VHH88_07155 [Verrucomicrobiae bacterium]|nr:hypothetical protein [Verrucomicrobiae bacterium]